MTYSREKAVDYAHRWAAGRNPSYANFDGMGGDCTNFISQCLFAGCGVMNYTRDTGWYYRSLRDRAAAWSGVGFLHRFLTTNRGNGPYGRESALAELAPGDIIQLRFAGGPYAHSLLVVETGLVPAPENILIATHTYDSDYRPLASYIYEEHRGIRIAGVRG